MAESHTDRVPLLRGLTFQQATTTLLVVLVLGFLVGAIQLFLDWRAMRGEIQQNLSKTLALVEGSASEALYQLHPELGRQLVQGLFVFEMVQHVELRDNFGRILAEEEWSGPPSTSPDSWAWLFDDITRYSLPLRYAGHGGVFEEVGRLQVDLSAAVLAQRFLHQASHEALFGITRALAISILVVIIFYFMITRPLLRLSHAITQVDPSHPARWASPRLRGHGRDELGLIIDHLERLLRASQAGLDQRDQAQRQLTALTRDLEQRVQDRTQALEDALAELEREKDAVERAFSELDQTHRRLEDANHLVVESIRYARRIQTALLPDQGVLGDAVREIQVCWEPLNLVGGDWYWWERRGEHCLFLVADCTGHGVPGAFMTLLLASAAEQVLREQGLHDPAALLLELDRAVRTRLHQDRPEAESDDGFDAAILLWDAGQRTLRFASAGGIPLLAMDPTGRVETFRATRGHLGYRSLPAPATITEQRIPVLPGMVYYLMTDGFFDQMGGEPRRLLGRRRLVRWLESKAELGLEEQMQALREMLEDYRGEEQRRDDMTLIGLRLI